MPDNFLEFLDRYGISDEFSGRAINGFSGVSSWVLNQKYIWANMTTEQKKEIAQKSANFVNTEFVDYLDDCFDKST